MRKIHFVFPILFSALCLAACMNIATSGAQAIYNHHSIQKSVNDQLITLHASQQLKRNTDIFKNSNISVATIDSEVLLAGQVPSTWQKMKAEQLIKDVPDVGSIHNVIKVEGTTSTLTRMSDMWITAKVKSKLIASNDVDATLVKVVTENGTVYLMGTLKPEQAEAATDLASNTDGVQSVVKVFSYIHITKNSKL
ncbi:MAG: BON domain-containing protein [Gammaproteobacteria bacterium]